MVLLICLFIFVGVPTLVMYLLDPDAVTEAFKRPPKYNVQDEMSLFNDAEWVKKVILSCNTSKQIWKAYKLSENLFCRQKCNLFLCHVFFLVYTKIIEIINLLGY